MKYLSIRIQNQKEPPNPCKKLADIVKLLLVSFIFDVIRQASQWQYLTNAVSSVIFNLRKVAYSFHLPSSALSDSTCAKCQYQLLDVSVWLLKTASRSAIMYRDNFRDKYKAWTARMGQLNSGSTPHPLIVIPLRKPWLKFTLLWLL